MSTDDRHPPDAADRGDVDRDDSAEDGEELTRLLARWNGGDERARETLVRRVLPELRKLAAIQLSRVGRYLERIADHGVNIGQHVTYIVTGSFPGDHKGAD